METIIVGVFGILVLAGSGMFIIYIMKSIFDNSNDDNK